MQRHSAKNDHKVRLCDSCGKHNNQLYLTTRSEVRREPEPGRARGRIPGRLGGGLAASLGRSRGITDLIVSESGSHMTLVVTVVYLHNKMHEYNLMSNF